MHGIKTQQLDDLFKGWKSTYELSEAARFSEDGILNEEMWDGAKLKVLFVLKERAKETDDFRKVAYDKPWWEIGYMNYFLQNTTKTYIPDFRDIKQNESEIYRYERMSAILNLKKVMGGSTSIYGQIYDYAERDKDNIKREINIIEPDVMVFGGTFEIFKLVFKLGNAELADRVYKNPMFGNAIMIDHVHPSQRTRKDMIYYTLSVYYQKIL